MSAERLPQHSLDSLHWLVHTSAQRLHERALGIERERDYLLSVLQGIVAAPHDLNVPDWLDARVRAAINNVSKP